MNKLNLHNQRKTLKIIAELCRNSPTRTICRPVNFPDNFCFLDSRTLCDMLQILESKELITTVYADYPENFNIYILKITPKGLDFEPQISYDVEQKWKDRIWGFFTGTAITALIQFLLS